MKLKHLLILFVIVCATWCVPLSASADAYPTSSYTLSDDGSTLVKWTGEESVIDMTSDPAFNQVTTIGEEAFAFNSSFTSITLPSNVTTIGQGAFNLATALETVLLPDGLQAIGDKAFRKCYAMKSISLPAQLKTIGRLAFENCEHLESVTLPASVTSLGANAFCDCYALKDITLSPSLTDWGEYSFTYCTVLEEVNIPEGITSIPAGTFYQCYEVKKISLPSSLIEIGEKAFTDDYHDADKIAEVTCRAIVPPTADYVWSAQQDDATLYVARRALSAYRNHAQWSQFGTILAYDGDDYPNEDFETDTEAVVDELLKNMVRLSGGTFTMGATDEQEEAADNEKPAREVTVLPFFISKYEVTQELWKAVMGDNPSEAKSRMLPVENVSWQDCQQFTDKLSTLTGRQFRLPTEAEWEFAARGGKESQGYKYAGSNLPDNVAWYGDEYYEHPVGEKMANELGLYDMSGNVGEWCSDEADWQGGTGYIVRGGNFLSAASACRVSSRSSLASDMASNTVGLRLVMDAKAQTAYSTSLIVKGKDGSETEFRLSKFPKVTIAKPNIIIKAEGTEIVFALSETDRIYYKKHDKEETDIDEMQKDDTNPFSFHGDEINLRNLPDGSLMEVYTINGRRLRSYRVSGSATFSLASLPAGVYVIKVNKSTYKISKR